MKYINGKYYTDSELESLIEKNKDSKVDDVMVNKAQKIIDDINAGGVY